MNYNSQCCHKDKLGFVYSCDKIRLSFELRRDCIPEFKSYIENPTRMDFDISPKSFKSFSYQYFLTVSNSSGNNIQIGFGFNGTKVDDNFRGFMEFNPNKVESNQSQTIDYILSLCGDVKCSRLDVAIDIPIDRNFVRLVKDNRYFEMSCKSRADRTEYLGSRNTPGRVKLYNKQIESKLDYPLTRLEITTKPNLADFKAHLPTVLVFDEYRQKSLEWAKYELTPTNQVLIESLLAIDDLTMRLDLLQKLEYRRRKKIEPFVLTDTKRLSVDMTCVFQVIEYAKTYEK